GPQGNYVRVGATRRYVALWPFVACRSRRPLLRLLRYVSWRKGRAFSEEKIFHVLGDEILRFFLPGHETVLVQDHLHPLFPELPGVHRDVLEDALPQFARPRRRIEAGQFLLKLYAEDLPTRG